MKYEKKMIKQLWWKVPKWHEREIWKENEKAIMVKNTKMPVERNMKRKW